MDNKTLPKLKIKKKSGSEAFIYNGHTQKATLIDFWSWYSSDLVSNATRGVLAEFIVAMALNQYKKVRAEWEAYDFQIDNGIKIEVKSAAFIQTWSQREYSRIIFNIKPTRKWDYDTNQQSKKSNRQADIYVFALLKHKNQSTINPLNLNQWTFFVINTKKLNRLFPNRKTITLKSLQELQPFECSYKRLKRYILKEAHNHCVHLT